MKEKIAFPQLVELVATKASTTSRMSELFLQELFAIISQALEKGETVKIKGLGTFKIEKDEDSKNVIFIPDNALAEAANAPFSQFKPVELCDEVTQEQLDAIDAEMQPKPATAALEEPIEAVEPVQDDKVEIEPAAEEVETAQEPKPEEPKQEEPRQAEAAPAQLKAPIEPVKPANKRKWIAIAASIAAIALIAGIVTHFTKNDSSKTIATTDTITDPRPEPAPVVTDTLREGNRLYDMAKHHYGDQAFWVYIALENRQQYPDYHDIHSGDVVVIPAAEKYGINSDSKKSLRAANAEAMKLSSEVKAMNKENGKDDEKDEKEKDKKAKKDKKGGKDRHHKRHHH
ncbi:MAG: HU family DNA-binding protein [Muribaculaceae bacterium]|nr:HU family DNA-binding protein [Muribaculaceae bacterium]